MRFVHAVVHGIALGVLATSTFACNTILGVEEVELNCHVAPELAAPPAAVSTLRNVVEDGDPASEVRVDLVAMATLYIRLWDGYGEHDALIAGTTYPLTSDDGSVIDCGICIELDASFNTPTGTSRWIYAARAQGNLTLTVRTATQVAGSIQNLRFRHVTDEGIEVDDGCSTVIRQLAFDAR
jgi:hypothetical protein